RKHENYDVNYKVCNLPQNVIRAYLSRKKQFAQIVENFGGAFISGLQPTLYSKRNPCAEERKFLERHISNADPYAETFKKMPFLYEKLDSCLEHAFGDRSINFETHFQKIETDEQLFGDIIHTIPRGDTLIAEAYFKNFRDLFTREA